MVSRWHLPYVGVICFGGVFVAVAVYGFVALSGDPGIGPGFTRVVLLLILLLGIVGVLVGSLDLYRHT